MTEAPLFSMAGAVLISTPVDANMFEAVTQWRNGYYRVVWHYKCVGLEVVEVISPSLEMLPSRAFSGALRPTGGTGGGFVQQVWPAGMITVMWTLCQTRSPATFWSTRPATRSSGTV